MTNTAPREFVCIVCDKPARMPSRPTTDDYRRGFYLPTHTDFEVDAAADHTACPPPSMRQPVPVDVETLRTVAREYIETAYREYRAGNLRREPAITAAEVHDYMRQHATYSASGLWHLSNASARTTVRNVLEGMRKRGELSSSTTCDTRGREVRAYEPAA